MNINKFYNSFFGKIYQKIVNIISKIKWNCIRALFNKGIYYSLTEEDHNKLRQMLSESYYIILTKRKSHFTTYLIGLLSLIKTGKWSDYTHALMNVDIIDDPKQWEKFKLMEATGIGVSYSTFMEVFDCDSVCLLKPKNVDLVEWNQILDKTRFQNGLPYDDLFDLADSSRVSCVEMVLNSLKAEKDYKDDFKDLEVIINKVGNLTPQMLRDCTDFEVVFEVKR